MTRLDRLLNVLDRFATALEGVPIHKEQWTRTRVAQIVEVGTTILSALAVAFPQVRGFAAAAGVARTWHAVDARKIRAASTGAETRNKSRTEG